MWRSASGRRTTRAPFARLLFVAVLLFLINTGWAQTALSGKVVDERSSLPGATVVLMTFDSVVVSESVTDSLGAFDFSALAPGKYRFSVSMIGYGTFESAILTLRKDSISTILIELREKVSQLGEVVIEDRRPVIEQRSDRVVIDVKQSIVAGGSSVLDVLSKVPGVAVNKQSSILSIHGKSGVVIMIDDQVIPVSPEVALQMLDGMSTAQVDRIEVQAVPSSRHDAQGNGGIIRIITQKSKVAGSSATLTLTAGARWAEAIGGSVSCMHRGKRMAVYADYAITRNHNRHELEINRWRPDLGHLPSTSVHGDRENVTTQQNLNAGVEWTFDATTIRVGLSGYSRNWNMDALNYERLPVASDTLQRTDMHVHQSNIWRSGSTNVALHSRIKEQGELAIAFEYLRYDNDNPSQYHHIVSREGDAALHQSYANLEKRTPIHFVIGKVDYVYRPDNALRMETGLKAVSSVLTNRVTVNRFEGDEWTNDPDYTSRAAVDENILAAYYSFQWQPNPLWLMQAGLRYEYTHSRILLEDTKPENFDRRYGYLFPQVSIRRELSKGKDFQVSYSRRVTRPMYSDIASYATFWSPTTFTAANVTLRPAIADAVIVGFHHHAFTVSLHMTQVANEINALQPSVDVHTNRLTYRSENLDYMRTIALSNSFSINPTSRWEMQAHVNMQYQYARTQHFVNNISSRLYGITCNVVNVVRLPKEFALEFSGTFQSRTRSGIVQYAAMGSLNVGVEKKMGTKGTLRLGIDDALYTTNWQTQAYVPHENIDVILKYDWHNQFIRLSYTLNLGNAKLKMLKPKGASDEERKRMGS